MKKNWVKKVICSFLLICFWSIGTVPVFAQGYAKNAYTDKNGRVMVEDASGSKYKTFSSESAFTSGFGKGKTGNLWW